MDHATVDMSSLWPASQRGNSEHVLNGIALGKDHVLLTGKNWDCMYKVVFPDWPTLFGTVDAPGENVNPSATAEEFQTEEEVEQGEAPVGAKGNGTGDEAASGKGEGTAAGDEAAEMATPSANVKEPHAEQEVGQGEEPTGSEEDSTGDEASSGKGDGTAADDEAAQATGPQGGAAPTNAGEAPEDAVAGTGAANAPGEVAAPSANAKEPHDEVLEEDQEVPTKEVVEEDLKVPMQTISNTFTVLQQTSHDESSFT